ncbi:hypothetical protein FHR92_002952 [Fontibacillus solani]|uniref:Uncharacterized protein n=1 Tax=Fontibacillus solani TaxID=1572857 RepID=A0A7W3SUQ4_9BACL|nr:hypothetical protein [Fontibacillus solani]MBA9086474.1 hypothetical protein [Fontibacillus solani]
MEATLNKKYSYLKDKLNEISNSAPLRKGKDDMIELDPKNPWHVEWFEKDSYKGE